MVENQSSRVLLALIALLSLTLTAPAGATDVAPMAEPWEPEIPELVAVDGAPIDDPDLAMVSDAAILVWGARPTIGVENYPTTVPISGQVVYSLTNPAHFLFYMWDGVSWAVCDTHPGYDWVGLGVDFKQFIMVDASVRTGAHAIGMHGEGLSCTHNAGMPLTWISFRITASDTAGPSPLGWHGEIGAI